MPTLDLLAGQLPLATLPVVGTDIMVLSRDGVILTQLQVDDLKDYLSNLRIQDDGVQIQDRVDYLNYTGTGVTLAPVPLMPGRVVVNIPGTAVRRNGTLLTDNTAELNVTGLGVDVTHDVPTNVTTLNIDGLTLQNNGTTLTNTTKSINVTGALVASAIGNAITINAPVAVQSYFNLAAFPASGTTGVLYIDNATTFSYRWDTVSSTYIRVDHSVVYVTSATLPVTGISNVLYVVVDSQTFLYWDGAVYQPLGIDVRRYASFSAFPTAGPLTNDHTIYIDGSDSAAYYWTGTTYAPISTGRINPWVPNRAYALGDLVIYDHVLFYCVNPHTSSGVFTFDVNSWKNLGASDSVFFGTTAPNVYNVDSSYDTVFFTAPDPLGTTINLPTINPAMIGKRVRLVLSGATTTNAYFINDVLETVRGNLEAEYMAVTNGVTSFWRKVSSHIFAGGNDVGLVPAFETTPAIPSGAVLRSEGVWTNLYERATNRLGIPATDTQNKLFIDQSRGNAFYTDNTGTVKPISQFVEYTTAALPVMGDRNVIYRNTDNGSILFWDGLAYQNLVVGGGGANIRYFDQTMSYNVGEIIYALGLLITPNDTILPGNSLAWGTTGSTYRPYGVEGLGTWMGQWQPLTTYNSGELVGTELTTASGAFGFALCIAGPGGTQTDPLEDVENWILFTTQPDRAAPFKGANALDPGLRGLVPAPTAGQQNFFLRGDGTWAAGGAGILPYDFTFSYNPGDLVLAYNTLITPNDIIPINTNFAWGTTGATWRPYGLGPTFTWLGAWSALTTYAVGDVVGYSAADGIGYAIALTPSTGENPVSATRAWGYITTFPESGQPFSGTDGVVNGTKGLVPAPTTANQTQFLRGDGTWATPAGGGGAGLLQYDQSQSYVVGDQVNIIDLIIVPNDTIPANTPFAWGTTGATWRPLGAFVGLNWRGQWNAGTAYVASDVVGFSGLAIGYAFALAPSTGVNPTSANTQWSVITTIPQYSKPFFGATSSVNGNQGVVPQPVAGDHNKYLRGDGTWAPIGSNLSYDPNTAYSLGDTASYYEISITANGLTNTPTPIPQWGEIGPNWRPSALPTDKLWRGEYNPLTTYNINDVVGFSSNETFGYAVALKTVTGESPIGFGDSWFVVSTIPQNTKPFFGATGLTPGKSGIVPAPLAGDEAKFLRGDGTWATGGGSGSAVLSYSPASGYSIGDVANYDGTLITPNATIPAGTPHAWGTTGATWRPHNLAPYLTFVGAWDAGTLYTNSQVVGYPGLPTMFVAMANSTGANPVSDTTTTQFWKNYSPNQFFDKSFMGASVLQGGRAGDVPPPLINEHDFYLRGDGTWRPNRFVLGGTFNTTQTLPASILNNQIAVDSSGGPITLTLPVPNQGDFIRIADAAGTWTTNNVTITTIRLHGVDQPLILDVSNVNPILVYIDATIGWVLNP